MAASTGMKRKLTTVFCADVQGYSTLMASDEAATLARLQRYRSIMGELFERHEGRKVNTWGDAVIAEFSSVVEAVRCAIEIQEAIGAENRDLPAARQMWLRIGINLGDVMQDGGDLYGDGVNVAARLESLADPGGIMVSESVYNFTYRHLSVGYDFAGEQTVKGQDTPISGYRVRLAERDDAGPGNAATVLERPARAARERLDIAEAPSAGVVDRSGHRIQRFRTWYRQQPRQVRIPVAAIGGFAAINLLTTGLSEVWYIYPSIPFVVYLVIYFLLRRK